VKEKILLLLLVFFATVFSSIVVCAQSANTNRVAKLVNFTQINDPTFEGP